MFNGNLNLRHQSEWTNIFDKSQRMVRMCSAEKKVYVNFVRRKYYSLALNHEVYSKVYIHQLFSISINFTGKFCHWHRQKWSSIFLRKNFYERFWEDFKELIPSGVKIFLKLYVKVSKLGKTGIHSKCFQQLFKKIKSVLPITYEGLLPRSIPSQVVNLAEVLTC